MKKALFFVPVLLLVLTFGCQTMDSLKQDLDKVLQKMEMERFNPKEEQTTKESISSHTTKPTEEEQTKPTPSSTTTKQKPGEEEYTLTITVDPEKSSIKLMNIDDQYFPGIRLTPGYYEVMVESKGYESYREWIKLDNDKLMKITLNKAGAAKVSMLTPQETTAPPPPAPVKPEKSAKTEKKAEAAKAEAAKAETVPELMEIPPAPAPLPKLPEMLTGHIDTVTSLSFSSDGNTLASGSYDSTIIIWSLKDGSILQKLNHGDKIRAVKFSPSGAMLASGGNDKLVKLWDVKTGKVINTFRGLADRVYSLEFSPRSDILAAGGNNELIIWNYNTGKTENHLKGGIDPYPTFGTIKAIAFNPQGKDAQGYTCAFSCQSGIALFKPESREIATIADSSMPGSITYSPSGQYIAWGARHQINEQNYFPRFAKVSTREIDPDISRTDDSASADRVFYIEYVPGGRQVVMLSYKQAVLYDIKTGAIIRLFKGTSESSVTGAALSPNGKYFAATAGNNIRIWPMD